MKRKTILGSPKTLTAGKCFLRLAPQKGGFWVPAVPGVLGSNRHAASSRHVIRHTVVDVYGHIASHAAYKLYSLSRYSSLSFLPSRYSSRSLSTSCSIQALLLVTIFVTQLPLVTLFVTQFINVYGHVICHKELHTVTLLVTLSTGVTRPFEPIYIYIYIFGITLQDLLVKRYGKHIFFAGICGRTDVCFRKSASHILNDQ